MAGRAVRALGKGEKLLRDTRKVVEITYILKRRVHVEKRRMELIITSLSNCHYNSGETSRNIPLFHSVVKNRDKYGRPGTRKVRQIGFELRWTQTRHPGEKFLEVVAKLLTPSFVVNVRLSGDVTLLFCWSVAFRSSARDLAVILFASADILFNFAFYFDLSSK